MISIAIFASGNGTNAENIMRYFNNHTCLQVTLLLCNNPKAKVLERATLLNKKCFVFNKHDLYESDALLKKLQEEAITHIVLAGFLWLIPENIIHAYQNKIINIHPALLPKYGGKGMYGNNVHEAVLSNGEKESGISIHFVNSQYDDGAILFQAKCSVEVNDTVDSLSTKIHTLEQLHYPSIIEKTLYPLKKS